VVVKQYTVLTEKTMLQGTRLERQIVVKGIICFFSIFLASLLQLLVVEIHRRVLNFLLTPASSSNVQVLGFKNEFSSFLSI
jgi:hypothetical protein